MSEEIEQQEVSKLQQYEELVKSMELVNPNEKITFRMSNKWNAEQIKTFAKEITERHNKSEVIRMSIDLFYKTFYNGDNEIKHKSFYCRKKLQKAFTELEIDCRITTTTKWNGCLVIQL